MFKHLALVAALSFAAPAFASDGDHTINYSNGDSAMNAAQEAARAELDAFLSYIVNDNGIGRDGSGVKVAFPIGGDNVEVIWITPFALRDGQLVGYIANEPRDIEEHNAGDLVTFERDRVRDWYFFGDDGKMYGSYTTRVMLNDLSAEEAEQIAQMLSDDPLPADW